MEGDGNACCADGLCPTPGRCIFCGDADRDVEMRAIEVDDLVTYIGWFHLWCEP